MLQIVFVGMFVGSSAWGSLADTYGRLPVSEINIRYHTVW